MCVCVFACIYARIIFNIIDIMIVLRKNIACSTKHKHTQRDTKTQISRDALSGITHTHINI